MARRRPFHEDHENHERWLISYADFITLLFAFFVVMYAVSVVNIGKYTVLSEALGDAFGGRAATRTSAAGAIEDLPLSSIVARKRMEAAKRDRERLALLARRLHSTLGPLVNSGKVRVTQNSRGVTVEINASVLFDEGDAALVGSARDTLQAVAGVLKDDRHAIEVEGHTDSTPIANGRFPSNWELSAARASTVVRLFADSGVAERRLAAVGRAANVPLAPNDDPIGRARNRRVAVTILAGTAEP